MSRSAVELDFFRMEKEAAAMLQPSKPPPSRKRLLERRRSFRDIQAVISKINPEILKTVIASGSAANAKPVQNRGLLPPQKSVSIPSTPRPDDGAAFLAPLHVHPSRTSSGLENRAEIAPLTIFYDRTVAVFDVPRCKAENILKLAEKVQGSKEATDPRASVSSSGQQQLLEALNGDLPIARRKSLERFLEKRKERVSMASPYSVPDEYA